MAGNAKLLRIMTGCTISSSRASIDTMCQPIVQIVYPLKRCLGRLIFRGRPRTRVGTEILFTKCFKLHRTMAFLAEALVVACCTINSDCPQTNLFTVEAPEIRSKMIRRQQSREILVAGLAPSCSLHVIVASGTGIHCGEARLRRRRIFSDAGVAR